MSDLSAFIAHISGIVWGEYVLIPLLALAGIYLSLGLHLMPWRELPHAVSLLFSSRKETDESGEITPFQALMTALSATVGTGNIAGVATAIYFGGPGAVFWMWLIALFGMATKYAEAVLAVHFRETNSDGEFVGGPMYYIKNGLGHRWLWLAYAFAIFGMLAAFGIGNMVQSNSVSSAVAASFSIPEYISGITMAVVAACVILGGVKRIARVAASLVPMMAIAYFLGALIILIMNVNTIPAALALIVTDAFTGTAASGGFLGATMMMALRYGFARGIFSNEAGLGSAAIAHAAAQTSDPIKQGKIAMLGTFIDTIIICSMTALVIITTGAWESGIKGAPMSSLAFDQGLQGYGGYIVTMGLLVFAFTTILGWSYYGERCACFVFGDSIKLPYRIIWIVAIFIGSVQEISLVWNISDLLNGLMAIPNLIALLLLSPLIFRLTREKS